MTFGLWKGRYWRERISFVQRSEPVHCEKTIVQVEGDGVLMTLEKTDQNSRLANSVLKSALSRMKPVASLWSYADASPFHSRDFRIVKALGTFAAGDDNVALVQLQPNDTSHVTLRFR